jgi:hypothetical protein
LQEEKRREEEKKRRKSSEEEELTTTDRGQTLVVADYRQGTDASPWLHHRLGSIDFPLLAPS